MERHKSRMAIISAFMFFFFISIYSASAFQYNNILPNSGAGSIINYNNITQNINQINATYNITNYLTNNTYNNITNDNNITTIINNTFYQNTSEIDPVWNANSSTIFGLINNESYLSTFNQTYQDITDAWNENWTEHSPFWIDWNTVILGNLTAINSDINANYTASLAYTNTNIESNLTLVNSNIKANFSLAAIASNVWSALAGNMTLNVTDIYSNIYGAIGTNRTDINTAITSNVTALQSADTGNLTLTNTNILNNWTAIMTGFNINWTAILSYTNLNINGNQTLTNTNILNNWTSINSAITGNASAKDQHIHSMANITGQTNGIVLSTANITGYAGETFPPEVSPYTTFGYSKPYGVTAINFNSFGMCNFLTNGTGTAFPSLAGQSEQAMYVKFTSAATANITSGLINLTGETRREYLPRIMTKIFLDNVTAQERYWFALTNNTLSHQNGTGNPTFIPVYMGIRFSNVSVGSNRGVDTNWQCCSGNGTTGTCDSITNAVVAINVTYVLDVKMYNSTMVSCTVKNSTNTYSVNKTNINWGFAAPAIANLGIQNTLTNTLPNAVQVYISWIYEQNG